MRPRGQNVMPRFSQTSTSQASTMPRADEKRATLVRPFLDHRHVAGGLGLEPSLYHALVGISAARSADQHHDEASDGP